MNDLEIRAFITLFREAYLKCFGHPALQPLSETESKLFYNKILDETGLVVGWKSLKNYSRFVLGGPNIKPENPSIATLDTLARYVLRATYSSETERKEKESHFPYWFAYKEKSIRSDQPRSDKGIESISNTPPPPESARRKSKGWKRAWAISGVFLLLVLTAWFFWRSETETFTDDFHDLSDKALRLNHWFVQAPDSAYWERRAESPDQLSLFTLRGDTWPKAGDKVGVPNLVLRAVHSECFEVEVHLKGFYPSENWQQAGLLLLEDTNFLGKALRVSLAYNDFSGGYPKPKEIIIQAITTAGKNFEDLEEIAHQPILYPDSARLNPAISANIENSFLKIEKNGTKIRILYAGGSVSNPAFRELITHEFDFHPKYIGLFAIRGFVDHTATVPVHFCLFRLKEVNCR